MPPDPLEVVLERAGMVESRHRVHAVLIEKDEVAAALGDRHLLVCARSCLKPIQLVPLARLRDHVPARTLATLASSHSGQPGHVHQVLQALTMAGRTIDDLGCGHHAPYNTAERLRLGACADARHHNCSGNHTAMLWANDLLASNVHYLDPEAEVQRAIADEVRVLLDVPQRWQTDNCNAPALSLPLEELARLMARFASSTDAVHQRIVAAMATHPWHVAGDGRIDTIVMTRGQRKLWCKAGAEGTHFVVDRETGRALALKVEDGTDRARKTALYHLLERWNFPIEPLASTIAWHSTTGQQVGEVRIDP